MVGNDDSSAAGGAGFVVTGSCPIYSESRACDMNPMAIALFALFLCASCRSPAPKVLAEAGDQAAKAGQYRFSTFDLRIDLDLRVDGTYYASMDSWARVSDEGGTWRLEGKDIVLTSQSGGLQMAVRRLGPGIWLPGFPERRCPTVCASRRALPWSSARPRAASASRWPLRAWSGRRPCPPG